MILQLLSHMTQQALEVPRRMMWKVAELLYTVSWNTGLQII